VEFSYFDVKSGAYKTLSTPEYTLNVAKGSGSSNSAPVGYVSKEELRLLGQDIRYINLGEAKYHAKGEYLYGTMGYWLWYIIPFGVFILIVVVYRKQAVESANVAKQKTKKASKVATRRLKIAKQKMREGDKAGFYDEVLKALWGYLSDKLNMPVSELSKDNVSVKLAECHVPEALVAECMELIGEYEFARYAPSLSSVSESQLYDKADALMDSLENAIKR
jgi:hypothetical protein